MTLDYEKPEPPRSQRSPMYRPMAWMMFLANIACAGAVGYAFSRTREWWMVAVVLLFVPGAYATGRWAMFGRR